RPVYGLYASCAAPALAIAFGSNRLLFTGPVGVMTLLVLGSLHHFAQAFSPGYIELAASLTLMVGVLTLLFAAARLGFLVRAIPTPVTEGFIAAAALLIIGTQVAPALGAPPPSARSGIHLPAFLGGGGGGGLPPRRSRPRPLRRLHHHRAPGAATLPADSRRARRRYPRLRGHVCLEPQRPRRGDGGGAADRAAAGLRPIPDS